MAELSDQEMLRYNRQIILRGFDFDGQEALKDSRVLVVGLGGLGCAASQYLASAVTPWRGSTHISRLRQSMHCWMTQNLQH